MSVEVNGDRVRPPLAGVMGWVRQHPFRLACYGIVGAMALSSLPSIGEWFNVRGTELENNSRARAEITAAAIAQDLDATSGVDSKRLGPNGYFITFRESARSLATDADVLNRFVTSVNQQTGCDLNAPPVYVADGRRFDNAGHDVGPKREAGYNLTFNCSPGVSLPAPRS